jgi:predicted SAM-dependent methyltransferase
MKLYIGCSDRFVKTMFNIDLRKDVKTDYCGDFFDLTKPEHPQAIPENSIEMIYCHMLEQLKYPTKVVEAIAVFFKWLQPGGVLRSVVPDLKKVAGYYVANQRNLFSIYDASLNNGLHVQDSKAELFLMFIRRFGNDVMLFDFDLMKELLAQAGFVDIEKASPYASRIGVWPFDRGLAESLFVEAIKPK